MASVATRSPRLINNFVASFTETLMPELVALEAPVQEFAQDYADIDETSFIPQTEQEVLERFSSTVQAAAGGLS